MPDAFAWSTAILLVTAGVSADVYLAQLFLREWRETRSSRRAARKVAAEPEDHNSTGWQNTPRTMAALAALLVVCSTTGTASAQQTTQQAPQDSPAPVTTPPTVASTTNTVPADLPSEGPTISFQLNLDYTTAYFYRGIIQEDSGLILQPTAKLTFNVHDADSFKVDAFVGAWNSLHGQKTGHSQQSDTTEYWYEADLFAGLTFTSGNFSLTTSYIFLSSPNDAFETVQELGFTLALDDSPWLHAWALKPYTTLAIETGADASDGADSNTGTYLELGISPGLTFNLDTTPITLTFPASVGVSIGNYYQNTQGDDDTLGFVQIGTKASLPLGEPNRSGIWTLNASISALILGDHTASYNAEDHAELIANLGVQWNF